MALEVNQVAAILLVACTEEMVEAHIIYRCGGLEGCHVATQLEVLFRRTQYGHDGVPADSRTNTTFQLQIARVFRLIFNGNSVYIIAGPCTCRYFHAAFAGF
ncbi:hypothetical protein D3C73_1218570 [compost metagenome]